MLFEAIVDNNFIYSYCATCHSSQGASVKGSITIHEYDLPIASREWLWCAITRCVDFNQVKFYKNGDYEKQMTKNMIMRYFKNKVENYKLQDRRSHREINEEEYITPEWCLKMFKSRCEKCNTASILKPSKASCVATLRPRDYIICDRTKLMIVSVSVCIVIFLRIEIVLKK